MHTIANVRVGTPDTSPAKPSHTRGVREGNDHGGMRREAGMKNEGLHGRGNARRSTGISPWRHGPIDPRMPNLSPS